MAGILTDMACTYMTDRQKSVLDLMFLWLHLNWYFIQSSFRLSHQPIRFLWRNTPAEQQKSALNPRSLLSRVFLYLRRRMQRIYTLLKKYWFIPYTLITVFIQAHVHAKLMRDLHIDLLISLGRWAQEMLDPTSNKSQKGNQTSGHVPPASSRAHCSWCPEDLRPSRTEGMRGSNTVWGWQGIRLNKRR